MAMRHGLILVGITNNLIVGARTDLDKNQSDNAAAANHRHSFNHARLWNVT
jgi:hypothetical protein